MNDIPLTLAEGLRRSGLSYEQLWTRCFALGGTSPMEMLREHIEDPDSHADDAEHNLIAQAINDYFVERGENHPVAYRNLPEPPAVPQPTS